MIQLTKKDWQECKQAAENNLKRVAIEDKIYSLQLETAERELKKYPEEEKEIKETITGVG